MSRAAARRPAPSRANAWACVHVDLLLESFERLTGGVLYGAGGWGAKRAQAVFQANFVLISHGLEADPLFNYANRCALNLFELDWPSLVSTPSRESAQPANQQTRERVMREVLDKGYVTDYSGIRISSSGRRFSIKGATLWNVLDDDGVLHGQAATFSEWRDLAAVL